MVFYTLKISYLPQQADWLSVTQPDNVVQSAHLSDFGVIFPDKYKRLIQPVIPVHNRVVLFG